MKLKGIYKGSNFLIGLLFILVAVLGAFFLQDYITSSVDSVEKSRDAIRISDIGDIHQAIRDYYTQYGIFPACLYKADCTKSLEATNIMPNVSKDPLSHLPYSYASFGKGAACTGYHLGASLERTGSQALLTGADAALQPASALCTGSKPDFSGVSYAKGGQPCNATAGTPAPSDLANAETCYDLAREVKP
jgi:hypothetical protein